jgi:hypothetical protein
MFPTFIFLIIGLISGAGALISFTAHWQTKKNLSLPQQPEETEGGKALNVSLEEAMKPLLEKNSSLETQLKDLKVALKLQPDTKKTRGKKIWQ